MERVRGWNYGAAVWRGKSSPILCSLLVRDTAIYQQSPDCIQVCTKDPFLCVNFESVPISGCIVNRFSLCFFFCRSFGEDNGMDYWSDDEDNEKMSRSWSSTSEDSLFNCDAISGNRKRHGHMYFEFFEVCSPYGRIPLIDKVNFYVLCDSSLDQLFLFPMLRSFFYRCMNYPRAILG